MITLNSIRQVELKSTSVLYPIFQCVNIDILSINILDVHVFECAITCKKCDLASLAHSFVSFTFHLKIFIHIETLPNADEVSGIKTCVYRQPDSNIHNS
jgi:hypothetical protein